MVQKEIESNNIKITDENAPAVLDLSINRPFVPKFEPDEQNNRQLLSRIQELLQQTKKEAKDKQNRFENFPLDMTVEFGQIEINDSDLKNIENGIDTKVKHNIGDNVNICLNGHLAAKGKLMSKDGKLGVLLTQIVKIEE